MCPQILMTPRRCEIQSVHAASDFKTALSWPLTIRTILTRKRFSRIARLLASRGKPREDIDAEESLDELIEKDEVVYMQGVDETCLGSPRHRVC